MYSQSYIYVAFDIKHKIVIWVSDDLNKLRELCCDYERFHDSVTAIIKVDFSVFF